MTEKEIKEYTDRKIKEIKKETECDDCILLITKDGNGEMRIGINNERVLVLCAHQVIEAYGKMGKNPYTRQTLLLRALTQNLLDEIKEEASKADCESHDIPEKAEDDSPAEEESGMVKRISKRGKPEAEDDPSVEK
nr:MAG TPA: hypothetical protein [Caudoviricetes sp.]